jgi:hypothetical protein
MIYRLTAARWIVVVAPLLSLVPACGVQNAPQNQRERPAEIPPPGEHERIDLDAFRAQFGKYSRGPLHTHTRRAICTDKSITVGCEAKVTIQAIGLSSDIDPDKAPSPGRVIGQIRNLDAQDITELDSLKPASQADYYIYVDAARSGRARWNLLEVPNAREGIIRRVVQEEVRKCGERPGFRWSRSDVDFARCGDHYLQNVSSAEMFTGNGMMRVLSTVAARLFPGAASAQSGKWYGCPGGCCT